MPDSSFTAINKPAGEFDFTNDGARPTGAEGWLCPALFKYFPEAPPSLYARAERIDV